VKRRVGRGTKRTRAAGGGGGRGRWWRTITERREGGERRRKKKREREADGGRAGNARYADGEVRENGRKSKTDAKSGRDGESEKKCTCARGKESERKLAGQRERERERILVSVEWGSRGVPRGSAKVTAKQAAVRRTERARG